AKDAGRKILVSGGGRCNVLPMEDAPARFVSESPNRLVRRFLDRWPLSEQRLFFEELLGGELREEPESRKLFPPSNRAKDVRDALREALAAAGGTLRTAAPVRDLVRSSDGFAVRLDGGEEIAAPRVILATGGRARPSRARGRRARGARHRAELRRARGVDRRLPLHSQGLERPGGTRRLARRRARRARGSERRGPGLLRRISRLAVGRSAQGRRRGPFSFFLSKQIFIARAPGKPRSRNGTGPRRPAFLSLARSARAGRGNADRVSPPRDGDRGLPHGGGDRGRHRARGRGPGKRAQPARARPLFGG